MSGLVPTFDHEINRKTLAAVNDLMGRFRFGDISQGQFETSMQTIWNCTAGIIQDEIQEIVVELMSDKPVGCVERKIFVTPQNSVVVIEHRMKDREVHILSGLSFSGNGTDRTETFETSPNPARSAKERYEAICELLGKKYREV